MSTPQRVLLWVKMKLPPLSWSVIQTESSLLWKIEQTTEMSKHKWVKVGNSLKLLKTTLTNQKLNNSVKPHQNKKAHLVSLENQTTAKKPEPRGKKTMSQIIPKWILLQRISDKSAESFPKLSLDNICQSLHETSDFWISTDFQIGKNTWMLRKIWHKALETFLNL